jgi:prepilin-type N-terminal cleavage/methylation domain-containing protein
MKGSRGFTIIELIVVIAIIGALSSVVLASVTGARDKAKVSAASQGVVQIAQAVEAARINSGETMEQMTGNEWTMGPCAYVPDTKLVTDSSDCYKAMLNGFNIINNDSDGMLKPYLNSGIRDPWGSPYMWDENELEFPDRPCIPDVVVSFGPDGINSDDNVYVLLPFISALCQNMPVKFGNYN